MSGKPAPSKNPILQTLLSMVGQSNVITVHRPLVDFLGSLEAAMLLGQLLYWTSRSVMGGWVAKSDQDFQDELCLARHSVRAAGDVLAGRKLVVIEVRRFNRTPTKHYRVDMSELERQWGEFVQSDCLKSDRRLSEIEQSDYPNSDNGLSENEQSLTEITTETTAEREDARPNFSDLTAKQAYQVAELKLYQRATGTFPGSIVWEFVYDFVRKHGLSEEQIHAAAVDWASRGYKSENVKGILEVAAFGWTQNGKGGGGVPAPSNPIPKPTLLCGEGVKLWNKAGSNPSALSEYQGHLSSCRHCGGASNFGETMSAIKSLAKAKGAKA